MNAGATTSNDYPAAQRLRDRAGRRVRAARIVAVLEDFSGVPLDTATLLDVGVSHGLIAVVLAERVKWTLGVDVDATALAVARAEAPARGRLDLALGSGMRLPFKDECMDLVVCNHVYEHVPDANALMREIARVLRPGGACYFAGGHRLQVVEPHYRLPFLSWLPRPWADGYLRATGRGRAYRERFVAPWTLPALFTAFASQRDVTGDVLRRCHRYGLGPRWLQSALAALLPLSLARLVGFALPTHVWMLRK